MSAAFLRLQRIALLLPLALMVLGAIVLLAHRAGPLAPPPASAGGATIVVDTTGDPTGGPGTCSLRQAIENANDDAQTHGDCQGGTGADTITFAIGGTIILASDLPEISGATGLTIDGGQVVTVSGDGEHQPFSVGLGAQATLAGLTVVAGSSAADGGGIANLGALTLEDSSVSGSAASATGGGIYNAGEFTVKNSAVGPGNQASDGSGVYNAMAGTMTVDGSTISGNSGGNGAGIFNRGTMTVTESILSNNAAQNEGGGIQNSGTLTLTNVTVSGNSGHDGGPTGENGGGGIFNSGTLTVIGSTVSGNETMDGGGGINNRGGTLELIGSSVFHNTAGIAGGGLHNSGDATVTSTTFTGNETGQFGAAVFNTEDGIISIANSTLSWNTAGLSGGGIFTFGQARFVFSTITENVAESTDGNGIFNPDALVELRTTIVAANSDVNCAGFGTYTSTGYNLSDDATCWLVHKTDLPVADPLLAPLADNGGPTLTHALGFGSPALDGGPASCPGTPEDQRGVPRPQGEACDIGAFELGIAQIWGDLDCDGSVSIGDALKTARFLLGLSVSHVEGCPAPGEEPLVNATPRVWGDIDCDGSVAIGDALKIARWLLELSVSQEDGCPEIGSLVEVAEGAG